MTIVSASETHSCAKQIREIIVCDMSLDLTQTLLVLSKEKRQHKNLSPVVDHLLKLMLSIFFMEIIPNLFFNVRKSLFIDM